MTERPRVFIGCATGFIHVAEAAQAILADLCEVTVWPDAFNVAGNYVDDLHEAAESHDFGIFVFTPDDKLTSPGSTVWAPRDNVVFEMGLFSGALGPRRVFVLQAEGESVKVPSDLAGITCATYRPPEAPIGDARWEAALRPAARQIGRAIERAQQGQEDEPRYLGVSRLHSSFPTTDFGRKVRRASRVRLLNTWLPNLNMLTPALEGALRAGCDVEVLLLHPYSVAARTRASTLGHLPGHEPMYSIAGEIKATVAQLARLAKTLDYVDRLKVKVYPEIPAVPIYQADQYILVGLFLNGSLAVQGPQLEVAAPGSVMAAVASNELEAVAASSTGPIDLHIWRDWLNGNI